MKWDIMVILTGMTNHTQHWRLPSGHKTSMPSVPLLSCKPGYGLSLAQNDLGFCSQSIMQNGVIGLFTGSEKVNVSQTWPVVKDWSADFDLKIQFLSERVESKKTREWERLTFGNGRWFASGWMLLNKLMIYELISFVLNLLHLLGVSKRIINTPLNTVFTQNLSI